MDFVSTATPQTPAPNAGPPSLEELLPQLLDIVPSTERLLSRILIPSPAAGIQAATSDSDGAAIPEHKRHLDAHQLDAAANAVRVKIQKARAAALALPDMDRTVEEQKEEIKVLTERIAKMKDMLNGLHRRITEDLQSDAARTPITNGNK